ncbi:MAG: fumarate hydratase [Candidatus Thermoplasmatota archaeon]|nr:fumarate hydratase [Candidatus Thermoplasmatota archaeon]
MSIQHDDILEEMAKTLVDAIRIAETRLPRDVITALEKALEQENSETGRKNLEAVLENSSLAEDRGVPLCQDTGIIRFFVDVGEKFPHMDILRKAIPMAVEQATGAIPLRPNTVDPFTGQNPGNNMGRAMPIIHWDITDGEEAHVLIAPKGGGCENASGLVMLTPGEGLEGVKRALLQRVIEQGGRPCPPLIIGLGIGGGDDKAMAMGKRASLRPIEPENQTPLEKELLDAVNSLGVGPMGMGGNTTALAVHIEYGFRHPASYPLGIVVQCWADRRSRVRIDTQGEAFILPEGE